jgi:DNA-directed RNA polymerase specialized sigma24 family protein
MTGIDRETFSALYRDHVSRVASFAARRSSSPGDVADLVAATFLAALERSDSYDPAKGGVARRSRARSSAKKPPFGGI